MADLSAADARPEAGEVMLTVRNLRRTFETDGGTFVKAVDGVSFEVPRGTMFTLLGPSGCGKTTTLRAIAGLETPDAGEIVVAGRTMFSSQKDIRVTASARGLGMMFQSYAVWPHMTVFGNVAFPLRVPSRARDYTRAQIETEVGRALEAVQLGGFEGRQATQLSGGQQQRLALARALISKPPLLLLDEPLSNLDAKLRESMRFELKRLQANLGITSVYVTHDQNEALALSHQIAVMNQGKIVQVGPPRDIYEKPESLFVAEFVGSTNIITGTIRGRETDPPGYMIDTALGAMLVRSDAALRDGEEVAVSIRPENIGVDSEPAPGMNVWSARVGASIFLGFHQDVELQSGDVKLEARIHPSVELSVGGTVSLTVDPSNCIICGK